LNCLVMFVIMISFQLLTGYFCACRRILIQAFASSKPCKDVLPINEERILSALEEVIDPEIGVNIVDLGLVYGIEANDKGKVVIEMTLTIPECPLVDQIVANVKNAAESVEGVVQVEVKLVFEPKWTPARMNDEAREQIRSKQLAMI
jgi:metal-sulfur cluster biosynthetic enzyme